MIVANIHESAVNTIRSLSIDAINKAHSGHPGMPVSSFGVSIMGSYELKFKIFANGEEKHRDIWYSDIRPVSMLQPVPLGQRIAMAETHLTAKYIAQT